MGQFVPRYGKTRKSVAGCEFPREGSDSSALPATPVFQNVGSKMGNSLLPRPIWTNSTISRSNPMAPPLCGGAIVCAPGACCSYHLIGESKRVIRNPGMIGAMLRNSPRFPKCK